MVAIVDTINENAAPRAMKQDTVQHSARIIQWLGGERAGRIRLINPY